MLAKLTSVVLSLLLSVLTVRSCHLRISSHDQKWFDGKKFVMLDEIHESRPTYVNRDEKDSPLYMYFYANEEQLGAKWIIGHKIGVDSGIALATSYALTPVLSHELESLEWKVATYDEWSEDLTFEVSCANHDMTLYIHGARQPGLDGYWVETGIITHGRRVWIQAGTHSELYMYYVATEEIPGRWIIGYELGSLRGVAYVDTVKDIWCLTDIYEQHLEALGEDGFKLEQDKFESYFVWYSPSKDGTEWVPDKEFQVLVGENEMVNPPRSLQTGFGQADVLSQVQKWRIWKANNYETWEGIEHWDIEKDPKPKHRLGGSFMLRNKIMIPQVSFGTRGIYDNMQYDSMMQAYRVGYRGFDLSPEHNNTKYLTKVLNSRFYDIERSELFITIKIWPEQLGFKETLQEAMRQLRELKTDYADLIVLNYPFCEMVGHAKCLPVTKDQDKRNWKTSWRALEYLYAVGKANSIGIANFDKEQYMEMISFAAVIPHVMQNWMDPVHADGELITMCKQYQTHFQAASTLLYIANFTAMRHYSDYMDYYRHVKPVATRLHKSYIQVTLKWFLQRGISVIPRTIHADRMVENYNLWGWELSREDIQEFTSKRSQAKIEHLHETTVETMLRKKRSNTQKTFQRKNYKKKQRLKEKRIKGDSKKAPWLEHEDDPIESLEELKEEFEDSMTPEEKLEYELDIIEGTRTGPKKSINYKVSAVGYNKTDDWIEAQSRDQKPVNPAIVQDDSVPKEDNWDNYYKDPKNNIIKPAMPMDNNMKTARDYA